MLKLYSIKYVEFIRSLDDVEEADSLFKSVANIIFVQNEPKLCWQKETSVEMCLETFTMRKKIQNVINGVDVNAKITDEIFGG